MIDLFVQFAIKKPKLAGILLFSVIGLLVGLVFFLVRLVEKKVIHLTVKSLGWKNAKIYKIGANIDGHYTGRDGPNYQVDYQDKGEIWHTKYCSVSIVGVIWYDEYY